MNETADRLDRILKGPAAIEAQTLFRIVRPVLALAGWRAKLESKATLELVALLRDETRDWNDIAAKLPHAEKELEANVSMLERVTIVKKEAPIAHVLWLRRVVGVLALTREAVTAEDRDADVVYEALRTDPSVVLPPLAPLRIERPSKEEDGEDHRLVDLELATIDHLMTAARAESLMLGRRRRLLVAARQRLLEAAAALPLERGGVGMRARWLAQEITRIDRLQGAGVDPEVSLVHQARQALTRRKTDLLYGCLGALEANGDRELSIRAGRALRRIGGDAHAASAEQSTNELLGSTVALVAEAIAEARSDAETTIAVAEAESDREQARWLLTAIPADAGAAIARAAIAADGFFEVGGTLAPVRVVEETTVPRVVKHPTRDMILQTAEDVNDLRDALVGDPRTILLDLAIGRLFARRYVRDEPARRSRVVLHGEVRVYVLDGSTSMWGTRARVRDAILVAELTTLMRRLETPRNVRCTLFYRYFNTKLGPVHRVQTIAEAKDAIRQVVSANREGGTNIQLALASSIAQIAEARAGDPDLARAQIVLITDGEAPVDEAALVAARDAIVGLPIGVSVIAIGEENPALRGLVARQRAKGEAAFYHFIEQADCEAIVAGEVLGDAVHAPETWARLAADPRALDDELGGLVEELEQIDRRRDHEALERLDEEARARVEVGLEHEALCQGERARFEALRKDRVALEARFARWFPPPAPGTPARVDDPALPAPGTPERDDIDAVVCALASVAEVVALLGGSTLTRRADAIDLIERILPDARLTPASYRAVLRNFPVPITSSLRALHDAVVSPGDPRLGDR
ncbi:MAG: VWA domain-containing protein [Labilithrix sp.]|nr:VWA domain-containing protein [Labilithrix sp.]MCW5815836.1 VWA domain-containing protein [Labilithrix sp.]